jgi:hypothetical protein
MAYTSAEAREQLLDDLAEAVDQIGLTVACLGEAYEHLDERTADELEQRLFRPAQLAYGRAKRTHAEFASRHGLRGRTFESPSPGLQSQGVKDLIEKASDTASEADQLIGALQDSMLPVEVGDPQLRAGLSEVRRLIAEVPARAHDLVRTVGR